MFVLSTDQWPLRTIVLRPDAAGQLRPYTCVYAVLDHTQAVRECHHCQVRMLAGPIFRDVSGLRVWHTECWLLELRQHIRPDATERWVLCTIDWTNVT